MTSCLLLTLFDSILVPILSEWISDEDLCYLDTAVCSKNHRHGFLATMSRCSIVNITIGRDNELDIYEWMERREMGLKRIEFEQYDVLEPLVSSLLTKTRTLSYMSINRREGAWSAFLNLRIRVHTLVLNCRDETLISFLTVLNNSVAHLDISRCFNISIATLSKVAALCPDLVSIQVPPHGVTIIASLLVNCDIKLKTCDLAGPHLGDLKSYEFQLSSTSCSDSALSVEGRFFHMDELKFKRSVMDRTLIANQFELISQQFHRLQVLHLKGNSPQCLLGSVVNNCVNLGEFLAISVSFGAGDLVTICKNSSIHLRSLTLDSCRGIDETDVLVASRNCPKLTALSVTKTIISEATLRSLRESCPLLTSISLSSKAAAELSKVESNFSSAKFERVELSLFHAQSGNRWKHLSASSDVCEDGTFFERNPGLLSINFRHCTLTDVMVTNMVRCCPFLRKITVFICRGMGSHVLVTLAQCRCLVSLKTIGQLPDDSGRFALIGDDVFETLLQDKTHFMRLDVGFGGYTSKVCRIVAKYCPSMRYLDVSYASDIVPCDDVIDLLNKCPYLHTLKLMKCPATDEARMKARLPRKLRLFIHCHRVKL